MYNNFTAVRVQEVIMSGSIDIIGNIRFNELNEGRPAGDPPFISLPQASPMWSWMKQSPTVNEIVYVITEIKDINGRIRNYFLPPININKVVNHNAVPVELSKDEYEAEVETSLDYFKEIENIRPLQPYLGDLTLEGRYGNSIRFGSTINIDPEKGGSHVPNNWSNEGEIGNPITIIRNGQTNDTLKAGFEHILEDINGDDSSIYLCSNQQISNFVKAGISPKNHPASYKHML